MIYPYYTFLLIFKCLASPLVFLGVNINMSCKFVWGILFDCACA